MARLWLQSWTRPVPPSCRTGEVRVPRVKQDGVDERRHRDRLFHRVLAPDVDDLHERDARQAAAQAAERAGRHPVHELEGVGPGPALLGRDLLGVRPRREQESGDAARGPGHDAIYRGLVDDPRPARHLRHEPDRRRPAAGGERGLLGTLDAADLDRGLPAVQIGAPVGARSTPSPGPSVRTMRPSSSCGPVNGSERRSAAPSRSA